MLVQGASAVLMLYRLFPPPFGIHFMNRAKPLTTDPKDMQLIGVRSC